MRLTVLPTKRPSVILSSQLWTCGPWAAAASLTITSALVDRTFAYRTLLSGQ
jgi:hypothetical protein